MLELPSTSTQERFWALVSKTEGCWFWSGSPASGYGSFRLDGSTHRAHRVAYAIEHSGIPAHSVVTHSCHNLRCVRPEHLVLKTQSANTSEAHALRRANRAHHRDANINGKLTADQVLAIRRQYAAGGITQRQLADEFGVRQPAICKIVRAESS
jgi:hypothetical protein